MRIALLSDCYLPRLGGIEVQVSDLAARLGAAGHDVEVFTATPGAHGERGGTVEVLAGVRVHRMALHLPGGIPVNPRAPRDVRRRLASGGFDVAHVHMGVVSPFATDMAQTALAVGLPTAITWHCVLDRSRPLMRLAGHARRWARAGAALSAVSSMAAARVADISGGGVVGVLGNGIDAAAWAPPDRLDGSLDGDVDGDAARNAERTEPPRPVRITSALRLVRRKRPEAILDVLREVRRQVPADVPLQADIFGDGPMRRGLTRSLEGEALGEWVRLRGRVDRDTLKAAHHDADLFVSTARLEAFGIAALEARAAGLPVVARAGTGIEDFVTDGVDGLLATDDAGLAAAVTRLVSDPGLRGRIRHHNATVAPGQDWAAVMRATLGEYARAAGETA